MPLLRKISRIKKAPTAEFNPNDKHANIALTNNNLTCNTSTGGDFFVRSTLSVSITGGKRYHEVLIGGTMSLAPNIGWADVSANNGAWLAVSTTGISWVSDGSVYFNSGLIGTVSTYAANSYLGFALDLNRKLVWVRADTGLWNNSASADPVGGSGGLSVAAITGTRWHIAVSPRQNGELKTINCGATPYYRPAPAGFPNWV